MKRIHRPVVTMTEDEYWRQHAEREPLPLMPRPCFDCAMVCEFYGEAADSLLEQPKEIQEKVKRTWFCHNHPDKACKGLADYMESKVNV